MLKSDIIIEINIMGKDQREINIDAISIKGKSVIQNIKNVFI